MFDKIYFIMAAIDESASEAAEHAHLSLFDLVIHSNIIFICIAFGLVYWLIKRYNLLSGIDKTQTDIVNNIHEAIKNREEAIKQLKEAEKSLGSARDEANKILEDAENTAKVLKEQIIKDAETQAHKILEQAHKTIENEKKQAASDIQQRLTNAAIEVARDNIKQSLDENWHKQMIENFVNDLSNIKVK